MPTGNHSDPGLPEWFGRPVEFERLTPKMRTPIARPGYHGSLKDVAQSSARVHLGGPAHYCAAAVSGKSGRYFACLV